MRKAATGRWSAGWLDLQRRLNGTCSSATRPRCRGWRAQEGADRRWLRSGSLHEPDVIYRSLHYQPARTEKNSLKEPIGAVRCGVLCWGRIQKLLTLSVERNSMRHQTRKKSVTAESDLKNVLLCSQGVPLRRDPVALPRSMRHCSAGHGNGQLQSFCLQ